MSSQTQSPADLAKDLASTAPRTLFEATELLASIVVLEVSAPITLAAQNAISGSARVRTLPQAKEALQTISTMLGSTAAPAGVVATATSTRKPNVPGSAQTKEENAAAVADLRRRVAMRPLEKRQSRAQAPEASAAPTSDAAIMARYETLKGSDRFAFFQQNREALVREDRRAAEAARAAVNQSVVEKYSSLHGEDRRTFFAQHHRELFNALRAQKAR